MDPPLDPRLEYRKLDIDHWDGVAYLTEITDRFSLRVADRKKRP